MPKSQEASLDALHGQSELHSDWIKRGHRAIPAFEGGGDQDVRLVAATCTCEISRFLPSKRIHIEVCEEDQIGQPKPAIFELLPRDLPASLPIFQW